MPNVSQLIQSGVSKLEPCVGDDALNEAFLLLSHATGRQVVSLQMNLDDVVDDNIAATFNSAIDQRVRFQPIAQIIGRRAFWKDEFIVTPDVLDPRPDTETLIEHAVMLNGVSSILDLGTGSGCILLSLLGEFKDAVGVGIDASPAALDVAKQNSVALGLDSRASFALGDWCDGITQKFDLIVSNPPYISEDAMLGLSRDVLDWEPRIALTPEGDGLGAYRKIIASASDVMNRDSYIMLEIGYDQGETVSNLLLSQGFKEVRVIQDLNNKDRVVQGQIA